MPLQMREAPVHDMGNPFPPLWYQENVAFQWDSPWYAHAANLGRADLNDTPVYTIFYAEWLINEPRRTY